jgi:chitodextrinase
MPGTALLDNLQRGTAVLAALFLGGVQTAAAKATITVFDVPNAVGTFASAIGTDGSVTGYWLDASYNYHGFVRAPDGTFTTFDPKGSVSTLPYGINGKGVVTGLL